MESITKNRKHRADIECMMCRAFPEMRVTQIDELKEGYFNAAYDVTLSDGRQVILKIAPVSDALIMSYEKNIMFSEVKAMELVKAQSKVPVPEIYMYDSGCSVCDAPYFIMEKIPGKSLSAINQELSDKEKSDIMWLIGAYTRQINSITGTEFGYPGQPDIRGKCWFPTFKKMMQLAVADAKKKEIDLKIDIDELFLRLDADEICFHEVQIPRLVHWDLWDGNIFVEKGKVTGIIDFERAIWGDPLMEVGFRSYGQSIDFLEGYGKNEFTLNEKKRIFWYDIYLFLLVALEYKYRKYETDETYKWATEMLLNSKFTSSVQPVYGCFHKV